MQTDLKNYEGNHFTMHSITMQILDKHVHKHETEKKIH